MDIKTILCPIDFSEFNQQANEIASVFAQRENAEIVYLTVPEQNSYNGDYEYAMQRTAERELKKLKEFMPTRADINCKHEVVVSSRTAQAIVEFASDHGVDLIVMSTHGRTGLRRMLMGSVAEYVVRKATCPVLTLRPAVESFAQSEPVRSHS